MPSRPFTLLASALMGCLSIAGAVLFPGCVSRNSDLRTRALAAAGEEAGAGVAAPIDWPSRDEAWADGAVHDTARHVDWFVRADGGVTSGEKELGDRYGEVFAIGSVGRVEFTRRVGVGVVREIMRGRPKGSSDEDHADSLRYFTAFTSRLPDGGCLAEGYFTPLTRTGRDRLAGSAELLAGAGLTLIDLEAQLAIDQGMAFYLDPDWKHTDGFVLPPPGEVPARGIFFLLLGLGGVDADDGPLYDEISRRGWRIVLIPTGALGTTLRAPITVASNTPGAIDDAGAELARFVDERLAEMAYIVEGAAEHLSRTRAELAGKPIVVMGYSGGALAAPAVAARIKERMPGRLAGLVVVCGGSNIADIAQNSVIAPSDAFIKWAQGAPFRGSRRLSEAYLRHAQLDPAAVGPRLLDVPTLIVKAKIDWAVPGHATDRLYHDLGRPDWWSYLAGHISVLDRLAGDRVMFAEWLDGALERLGERAGERAGAGRVPVAQVPAAMPRPTP